MVGCAYFFSEKHVFVEHPSGQIHSTDLSTAAKSLGIKHSENMGENISVAAVEPTSLIQ